MGTMTTMTSPVRMTETPTGDNDEKNDDNKNNENGHPWDDNGDDKDNDDNGNDENDNYVVFKLYFDFAQFSRNTEL